MLKGTTPGITAAQAAALYLPLTGGTLTGGLLFTDNTYDIGAAGATRPRAGYFGTSVTIGAGAAITSSGAGGALGTGAFATIANYATLAAPTFTGTVVIGAGQLNFSTAAVAVSTMGFWNGGGTTMSAKGGSGGYTFLNNATNSNLFTLSDAGVGAILDSLSILGVTTIPAGGTAAAGYRFSSTTNFGVFFGSGAPTLSAAKGSLYLRSDGTGAADRAYINTNSSTTWTAIATAG